MAGNRRLTKELASFGEDPIDGVIIGAAEDDMFRWQAVLEGPADTPYAGGIWEIDIVFPPEYPFKAPKVTFKTQIYHPNIKKDTGEICADVIINSWAPTLNVRYVMNTIKALVKEPNTETPLEPEIAELYTTDREKFNAEAKAHAAQFAGAS